MLTHSFLWIAVPLAGLCLMLSVVEVMASQAWHKLAMQAVLLMSAVGWLAQEFHLTGPVAAYGREWVESNLWGW